MNSLARCSVDWCVIVAISLSYCFLTETMHAQSIDDNRDQTEIVDTTSNPQILYWNQFRGPNGSGVAAVADPPIRFDRNTNLLWSAPLLPGASSPCIWGDRIFLTTYDTEAKKLEVVCLDRNDGKILWRVDIEAKEIEKVHPSSSPASGTITTDGKRVYVYFGSRGLLCYDFKGNLVWAVDMPIPDTLNGSGTSPVVAGDVVLLNREEESNPYLLAVNKVTGAEVWRHAHLFAPGILNESSATPIVWKGQVILHTHEGIYAIALADGKPTWQVNTTTTGVSTPVISGNMLLVATWQPLGEEVNRQKLPTFQQLRKHDADKSGTIAFAEFPHRYSLFARPESSEAKGTRAPLRMFFGTIDSDKNRELTEKEWKRFSQRFSTSLTDHGLLSIRLGGKGDLTETHVNVLEKKNIAEVPSPLAYQGRIYMVKDGGIVNCLDATSGKRLFLKRMSATGSYFASPIAANGRIYLTSSAGIITVLQAGDEYHAIARNDLSERILATPAAVDDTLYVRTAQHLYAFQKMDSK